MSERYDTDVLNRFIERVRQSVRSRNKQLTLSIEESQDLVNALALLLIQENELQSKIIELQEVASIIEVAVAGGSFK